MTTQQPEYRPPTSKSVHCEHCQKYVYADFLRIYDREHKIAQYKCPGCEGTWLYNYRAG